MRSKIPNKIEDNEIIVRGVLHPLMLSNGKIKFNAFLPPPYREDAPLKECIKKHQEVSMLRLNYTNETFCKKHSKSIDIPNNTYKGLAFLVAGRIKDANNESYKTSVKLKYSPYPNLDMHVDLLYNTVFTRSEPNPAAILIAKAILSKSTFVMDNNPDTDAWDEPKLTMYG